MGGPTSVSMIRHLQNHGHRVIGMDCRADAVGRHFCDDFRISPPALDVDLYVHFLKSLDFEFDVFFPFVDEELRAIALAEPHLNALRQRLFLSPDHTLLDCTDKVKFQKLATDLQLPIAPLTLRPPAIAKPRHGRGGKGVVTVDDAELLTYFLQKPDYLCQQKITGDEYTVDILVDHGGQWVFGAARRRILARGVSVIGQIDMADDVLRLAHQVVSSIRFRGPINIQMIREANTGHLYLIEVNPRLSGSLIFSTMAGFDIFSASLDVFAGRIPELPESLEDGLCILRYWSEQRG